MVTKTIVLNQASTYHNSGSKNARGLISLSGENNILGELRLYNVSYEKDLKMLISIGGKNFLFHDVKDDFTFKIVNAPSSDDIFVVVAQKNDEKWREVVSGGKEIIDKARLFDEPSQDELDELILSEVDESELKTLSNQEIINPFGDEIENKNFYSLVEGQIDELFSRFPRFSQMEAIIPDSEWVRVCFSDNEDEHYLLGKLFADGKVSHICYAIPAKSEGDLPPKSLEDFVQWIPLDPEKLGGRGYWMMYQDAKTGENVRV